MSEEMEKDSKKVNNGNKMNALKENNMFYFMSLRTVGKQVVGFSLRMMRYDIVEKVFRHNVIIEQVYRPSLFNRKENYEKNGISDKKFKKLYSNAGDITKHENEIYDVVNKGSNLVMCSTMDPVAVAFLKKRLKKLNFDNIKLIEPVSEFKKNGLGSGLGSDFCSVDEVFADSRAFIKWMKENMN